MLNIPVEILLGIVQLLKPRELRKMRATCRTLRLFIDANEDSLDFEHVVVNYRPMCDPRNILKEERFEIQHPFLSSNLGIIWKSSDFDNASRFEFESNGNFFDISKSEIGAAKRIAELRNVPFVRYSVDINNVLINDYLMKPLQKIKHRLESIVFDDCFIEILTAFPTTQVTFNECSWPQGGEPRNWESFSANRIMCHHEIPDYTGMPSARLLSSMMSKESVRSFDCHGPVNAWPNNIRAVIQARTYMLENIVITTSDERASDWAGVATTVNLEIDSDLTTKGVRRYVERLLDMPPLPNHTATFRLMLYNMYASDLEQRTRFTDFNPNARNQQVQPRGKAQFWSDNGKYVIELEWEEDPDDSYDDGVIHLYLRTSLLK